MWINKEDGQMSLFDQDLGCGKMSPEPSPAPGEKISKLSSNRSSKLKNHTFMLLDLRPGAGNMLGPCWEYDPAWLGSLGTLNTSECPSDVVESSLSQILQDTVPSKYYLSPKACVGILRRAKERGKKLPGVLEEALKLQAGVQNSSKTDAATDTDGHTRARPDLPKLVTEEHGDDMKAHSGMFAAGFSAGAGASAGSIGYEEETAPTLKGSASGNCMPTVLCLNDQGGSVMDVTEEKAGTLRAQVHGHAPLIFENHGIDARYTGPHAVAPTLPARAGTGGNNLPLVAAPEETYCITGNAIDRQPQNGGNGIGYQQDLAYTLTATDHHAVFRRQRVDLFQNDVIAGTQSARQHKDATDFVFQHVPTKKNMVYLIRRLIPLECERLQGYPDGWTNLPKASDSNRYKALGNSVAIPCVQYLIQRIAMCLMLGFQGYF